MPILIVSPTVIYFSLWFYRHIVQGFSISVRTIATYFTTALLSELLFSRAE